MSVRRISQNNDFTFGRGKADYISGSKEIRQNVVTRLRSFTNDFFLDVDNGNPWLNLLGVRGNEKRIIRQIEKTVLTTDGVVSINSIRLISVDINRDARIELSYVDAFSENIVFEVSVT